MTTPPDWEIRRGFPRGAAQRVAQYFCTGCVMYVKGICQFCRH